MASRRSKKRIVVTGDVTMDCHFAHVPRPGADTTAWSARDFARLFWQRGGAALLADLIGAVATSLEAAQGSTWELFKTGAGPAQATRGPDRAHHSYALWSPFPYSDQDRNSRSPRAWRVRSFLGLDRAADEPVADWQRVVGDPADADVVVLDDADLGFRNREELWPRALVDGKCRWVLVKLARPVADGPLWKHLFSEHAERLVVVLTVDDLRLTEVQISRALSWERTAQDVLWELVHNPAVNSLSQCAAVVVTFDTTGALLLEGRTGRARLYFDPALIEGEWAPAYPGGVIGYTSCLIAGIARQLMLEPAEPDLDPGIRAGLAAMRRLHLEGYGDCVRAFAGQAQLRQEGPTDGAVPMLDFPIDAIVEELARDDAPFAVQPVRDPIHHQAEPAPRRRLWTILEDRYPSGLEQVAERVALEGVEKVLTDVPLGRFGDLVTVDRQEIEAFRSLRSLVLEYVAKDSAQPLSIAVFGDPGSGKSFGVTQVAKALLPGRIKKLTFNLSQFEAPGELIDAFHQIRDVSLSGQLPLVFWDEFDAPLERQLGWLPHFLAPMQDGEFQHGQITHPIGRAIFVFAGGTYGRMEEFGQDLSATDLKRVKVPDFVSRIKGYVNILGPNPVGGHPGGDAHFVTRRAILLRSILRLQAPRLFEGEDRAGALRIDPGVLRAFLYVSRFRHGVRSIESIVAMSSLAGKRSYERSCLPSESQLDLHVNGVEFLALVQRIELRGELLERLARAVHESFCEGLEAEGYVWGPENDPDDDPPKSSSLVDYGELSEDEKEQNRGNARDIPNKLAVCGYVMIPARSEPPDFEFPGADLEILAEMEHERWMRMKLEAEWRWAAKTDKQAKLHKDLLAWRELNEEERIQQYSEAAASALGPGVLPEAAKEKDRILVRGIPDILKRIGYTIVKVTGAA